MTQDLTKINSPWGLLDEETKTAVKKAERNGKIVQWYSDAGWADHHPSLHGWIESVTYRIKPEPEVVSRWANVYDNECVSSYSSREMADKHQRPNRICVLRIDYCDGVPSFHKEEN